jgi:hypothetical protein
MSPGHREAALQSSESEAQVQTESKWAALVFTTRSALYHKYAQLSHLNLPPAGADPHRCGGIVRQIGAGRPDSSVSEPLCAKRPTGRVRRRSSMPACESIRRVRSPRGVLADRSESCDVDCCVSCGRLDALVSRRPRRTSVPRDLSSA